MKTLFFLLLFVVHSAFANTATVWGATGHRVVGKVAEEHLSKSAKRAIKKLLKGKSLAFVSTFADDIKADRSYRAYSPWHYVNMPLDKKYGETPVSEYGDLIKGIQQCIATLKDKNATDEDKVFYLKMLVHFIGDLHQPLHVGRAEDRGGNDIQIQWFGRGSNLHRVWDSNMIDSFGMSFTELSDDLPPLSRKQKKALQQGKLMDWVYESQALAKKVYASAEKGEKLGYRYMYDYFDTAKEQLQKGGLRLAKVLNELF